MCGVGEWAEGTVGRDDQSEPSVSPENIYKLSPDDWGKDGGKIVADFAVIVKGD